MMLSRDTLANLDTVSIRGDVVTIYFDQDNNIDRLIAERVSEDDASPEQSGSDERRAGELADFRQRPEENEEFQHARANRMEWFANENRIVLLGNAESWQGDDRIAADRIVYDTLNGRVLADQGKTGRGRAVGRVRFSRQPALSPDLSAGVSRPL